MNFLVSHNPNCWIKDKMGKSSNWYHRHTTDAYVKKAREQGRRSRAIFKLSEILRRYTLLEGGKSVVVDLGCSPGSWCQELVTRVGKESVVVGMDVLPMEAIQGVEFIQADFTTDEARRLLTAALSGRKVDLVLSDMSPELSGHKLVDQARMIGLNEEVLSFALHHLRRGGHLLLKTFMGEGFHALRNSMSDYFSSVKIIKPAASRKTSSEIYLLAREFKGMSEHDGS